MFNRKTLIAVFGLVTSLAAGAQGSGYYQTIPYRNNDPFLFCTNGLQGAQRERQPPCWMPTPPYLGTYMTMPYCRPPVGNCSGYYCIDDTQDEISSLNYYQMVCPQAMTSGQWQGSGQPQSTPYTH